MLAEAMEKVGKEGVITVEEAKGMESALEIVEGMQFDRTAISRCYFVTNAEKMTVKHKGIRTSLSASAKCSRCRTSCRCSRRSRAEGHPLVIVADEIEGEALATLVVNKLRGLLKVIAIKAPGFGDRRKDQLKDLAVLTGGQVISEDLGLKLDQVTLKDYLGRAKRVTADKDTTTIVDGAGGRSKRDQVALRSSPQADRKHGERLRSREDPRAPREARGRRRGRQSRRAHRDPR